MSKKILQLCLSPDLGGLELFALTCYEEFSSQTECFFALQEGKKIDNYLDSSSKIYLKRGNLSLFFEAYKLAKFIDRHAIDIIHFHWTKDIRIAVLAKTMSRRPLKLIQSRHMNMTRFKDDFYHKWLYKNIDVMHAVTYGVEKQLKKFIPQKVRPKIETIYLGVRNASFKSTQLEYYRKKYELENSFVIGIIGRIEEEKGQHLIVEALAKLKEYKMKALIVGAPMNESYLRFLKEKVQEYKLEKNIIFSGFTKEISEHIQLCDITVLATTRETFGLVVIESMVNSVPVIATNQGGPLEIIDDGVDGLFFDRSVEDLVEKMKLLYHNRELKKRLSSSAVKKIQRQFNKELQMAKMYEMLIL